MNIVRLLSGGVMAVFVTFVRFSVMVTLIAMNDEAPEKGESRKLVDITMPDTKITEIAREPKPQEPDEPPPPPDAPPPPSVDTPDVDMSVNTNVATFKAGGGANFKLTVTDGEYLPLVRVQPQYPRRAQSRGLEGWVIIHVDVLPSGQTANCVPIEGYTSKGSPTTIWNSSACKAAAKFKYKPRVVDGVAQLVKAVPYKFTFEMAD